MFKASQKDLHMPSARRNTIIKIKRAYDPANSSDGFRIYVDRLWPRGLSHATFKYDLWDKEIAPSTDLRHWFHADPAGRWKEFLQKYMEELDNNPASSPLLEVISKKHVVSLLYSSRERTFNNAAVLRDFLQNKLSA